MNLGTHIILSSIPTSIAKANEEISPSLCEESARDEVRSPHVLRCPHMCSKVRQDIRRLELGRNEFIIASVSLLAEVKSRWYKRDMCISRNIFQFICMN